LPTRRARSRLRTSSSHRPGRGDASVGCLRGRCSRSIPVACSRAGAIAGGLSRVRPFPPVPPPCPKQRSATVASGQQRHRLRTLTCVTAKQRAARPCFPSSRWAALGPQPGRKRPERCGQPRAATAIICPAQQPSSAEHRRPRHPSIRSDTEGVTGSNPVAPTSTDGSLDSLSVVACQRFAREPLKVVVLSRCAATRCADSGRTNESTLVPGFSAYCAELHYDNGPRMHGASPPPIDAGDVLLGSRMDRAGGGCLTSYGHRQSLHSTMPTMGTLVHCCPRTITGRA
jgi:hypothetical protein